MSRIDFYPACIGLVLVMFLSFVVIGFADDVILDSFSTESSSEETSSELIPEESSSESSSSEEEEVMPDIVIDFPDESSFEPSADGDPASLTDVKQLIHLCFLVLSLSLGVLLYLCFRRIF